MSFYTYKNVIEEGDLVLVFIGRNDIKPITVTKGAVFNTRYGHFKHDDMVGMRFGEQMVGAKGYGFVHLLHPTPELWTLSLPHRTQIVYTHDSAYIAQRLGVTAGTRVIEAGTGSASFTHSFARTVGLSGRVFTYEFHEPRYLEARAEIHQHGLDANTWITHRDVCEDGFEIEAPTQFQKNSGIEAEVVFLDLPSPWTAIPHLDSVISSTERIAICCFSPCIEQVDKTVKALEQNGWVSIEMVEVAGKRWEARKDMVRNANDVITRLKDIHSRRGQGLEAHKSGSGTQQQLEDVPKNFNPFGRGQRIREGDEGFLWRNVTKIEPEIRGHTSYLTFAYKLKQNA